MDIELYGFGMPCLGEILEKFLKGKSKKVPLLLGTMGHSMMMHGISTMGERTVMW